MGKHATHCVLGAQLITQGKNFGLHFFVVPIRDPGTRIPYPGVDVGDIGVKMGWNWLDHGYLMLSGCRIPRENLLNKYQDVNPDGTYVSGIKTKQRFGLTLGALAIGRVGISDRAVKSSLNGLTIALRYSAARRQFGDPFNKEKIEIPILEYQLQQQRLLPFLAGNFAMSFMTAWLKKVFKDITAIAQNQDISDDRRFANMNAELHAIASGSKPVSTWYCIETLQTCRECLGGHGFSIYSGVSLLRLNNEPSVTYEGENNVLIQQCSQFLLKNYKRVKEGQPLHSPLGTLTWMDQMSTILSSCCPVTKQEEFIGGNPSLGHNHDHNHLLSALKWRVCYLLEESVSKLLSEIKTLKNPWTAWNHSQSFYFHALAKAFVQLIVVERTWEVVVASPTSLKPVLEDMANLYTVSCVRNDLHLFLEGQFFQPKHSKFIKNLELELCEKLVPNSIALIDSIALPDSFQSALGKSDGKIYDNLWEKIKSIPGHDSRPSYWELLRTPVSSKL
eukprot:TRINITY_DN2228_c0_g1_i5.p1 TRINITY_DN2228_c0_g1~~TRINITY_DN2228_c0_g1_i5.p1  ORF type:complete len:504 (-),score=81.99 TRINITY_DN2228_c0_g1_i5:79-1590(-)